MDLIWVQTFCKGHQQNAKVSASKKRACKTYPKIGASPFYSLPHGMFKRGSDKTTNCEPSSIKVPSDQARGYKTFFILNSNEHEISTAHKN